MRRKGLFSGNRSRALKLWVAPAVLALALATAPTRVSAIPDEITYQAYLTNAAGVPITSNNVDVTIEVYDAPAAGALVFTHTVAAMDLGATLGFVNIQMPLPLGPPGIAALNGDLYVQVTITDNVAAVTETLLPRQQIVAAPTALNADFLDGLDSTELATLSFINIAVPAGTNPVALTPSDTLTLAAGANVTITGDAGTNTITIDAASGLTPAAADMAYLRLDASNDPITGDLAINADVDQQTSGVNTSVSGEMGAGLSVRAEADPAASRATAMRARMLDSTVDVGSPVLVQGAVGSGQSAGGDLTQIDGGYFQGRVLSSATSGAALVTGVGSEVDAEAGAAGFLPSQAFFGGRFVAQADNIGAAQAAGSVSVAQGAHAGPSVGAVGVGRDSLSVNTGVTGAANASDVEVATLPLAFPAVVNASGVGVLAYNNTPAGTALFAANSGGGPAIVTVGDASVGGDIAATGNITGANLSGTNTGDQLTFTTISTPAGTSPVADLAADTLTLAAGSGITITGDDTTDTVTIASTGLTPGDADMDYLRLDGSNDPVTGDVEFSTNIGVGTAPAANQTVVAARTMTDGATPEFTGRFTGAYNAAAPTGAAKVALSGALTHASVVNHSGQLVGVAGTVSKSSAGTAGTMIGVSGEATVGGANASQAFGMRALVNNTGSATSTSGVTALVTNQSGTTNFSTGGDFTVSATGATGSAGEARAVSANITTNTGGTIGTGYGVYVGAISATNPFGVYVSDAVAQNYFAGPVEVDGVLEANAAGNTVGNTTDVTQLTVNGVATGAAANNTTERDLIVVGDARVDGDLKLGAGSLHLGTDAGDAYINTSTGSGEDINVTPDGGFVNVDGIVTQTGAPAAAPDLVNLGYLQANYDTGGDNDLTYLRLDASNDPVTGDLALNQNLTVAGTANVGNATVLSPTLGTGRQANDFAAPHIAFEADNIANPAADGSQTFIGSLSTTDWQSGNNLIGGSLSGAVNQVLVSGSGNVGNATAAASIVNQTNGGIINIAEGHNTLVSTGAGGTINTAIGVGIALSDSGGAGTITNGTGLFIGSIDAATPFAIRSIDTNATNQFRGPVVIGSNANTQVLTVDGTAEGIAATFPADYEVQIDGDAQVEGDLKLGAGSLHLGSDGAGAYIATSLGGGEDINITPDGGFVNVDGIATQTGSPAAANDLVNLSYLQANYGTAADNDGDYLRLDGTNDPVTGAVDFAAAGNSIGDNANATQLTISGVATGAAANATSDRELIVVGDARIDGDLKLGMGSLHAGSDGFDSYLRTSGAEGLDVTVGSSVMTVQDPTATDAIDIDLTGPGALLRVQPNTLNANAGPLNLNAASVISGVGIGGDVALNPGSGFGGGANGRIRANGNVQLIAGETISNNNSGQVDITNAGGTDFLTVDVTGPGITLHALPDQADADAGSLSLLAAEVTSGIGNGGDIVLAPGSGSGGGADGRILAEGVVQMPAGETISNINSGQVDITNAGGTDFLTVDVTGPGITFHALPDQADADAGSLSLLAAEVTSGIGDGGDIVLTPGSGSGGGADGRILAEGVVQLDAGETISNVNSGQVDITNAGGTDFLTVDVTGPGITLRTLPDTANADAGSLSLLAAEVTSGIGNGGDIVLTPGSGSGGGANGRIRANGVVQMAAGETLSNINSGQVDITNAGGTDFLTFDVTGPGVSILAGPDVSNASAGDLLLSAPGVLSGVGDGGSISLTPGAGSGGGLDGVIFANSDVSVTGKVSQAGSPTVAADLVTLGYLQTNYGTATDNDGDYLRLDGTNDPVTGDVEFSTSIGVGVAPSSAMKIRATATDSDVAASTQIANFVLNTSQAANSVTPETAVATQATNIGTGNLNNLTGMSAQANQNGSGIVSTLRAIHGTASVSAGTSANLVNGVNAPISVSGTVSTLNAMSSSVSANTGGSIVSATGVNAAISGAAGSNIGNATGINVGVSSSGTIGTGIGVNIGTISGTTKYSLFAGDPTAPSYHAGGIEIDGVIDGDAAGNTLGSAANATQLTITGVSTGAAANSTTDRELIVVGDARIDGDLKMGMGSLHMGASGGNAYINTSAGSGEDINMAPDGGDVNVTGKLTQTGTPSAATDVATVGYLSTATDFVSTTSVMDDSLRTSDIENRRRTVFLTAGDLFNVTGANFGATLNGSTGNVYERVPGAAFPTGVDATVGVTFQLPSDFAGSNMNDLYVTLHLQPTNSTGRPNFDIFMDKASDITSASDALTFRYNVNSGGNTTFPDGGHQSPSLGSFTYTAMEFPITDGTNRDEWVGGSGVTLGANTLMYLNIRRIDTAGTDTFGDWIFIQGITITYTADM